MTEENAGQGEQAADLAEREVWYDLEHRDWALQMFVGICNLSGIEIPVTLNLSGSYVSGHIVKPEIYFDGLKADLQRATFQGGTENNAKKLLEDSLSRMREMVAPTDNEKAPGPNPRTLSPRYVHLRGARFFVPNDPSRPLNPPQKLWWRGKIESVNGFFIGMPFSDKP